MEENEFRRLYRKTPFWRTKLVGMQRNALIAAANTHRIDLLPVIEQHLNSPSLVVAETAAWAKTKIETNKHGNESLFS
jgi:epoxyqueuosine reductase